MGVSELRVQGLVFGVLELMVLVCMVPSFWSTVWGLGFCVWV